MEIDNKAVNELRVLSSEMITKAKSGHTGVALDCMPILYSLYANVMAVNPEDSKNFNRDRFVLSSGHASSALYAILYAMNFGLTVDDLKNFRQLNSFTPGHPEVDHTNGVDCSTGPLGQGIANAVGMAIAEKKLSAEFNKDDCTLVNNNIYCLCGDGDLQEGVANEALSLAGNLKLDNFVLIYDRNKITIEGGIELSFSEDIKKRFKAIGFDVFCVKDGNNVDKITKKLKKATKSKRPSIVVVDTHIGFGTKYVDNCKIHGMPLSVEELDQLKLKLSVIKPDFELSTDVKQLFKQKIENAKERLDKRDISKQYKKTFPKEYKEFRARIEEKFYAKDIERIKKIKFENIATTRNLNFEVMQQMAKIVPSFFGGSADVAPSTMAYVQTEDFSAKNYGGSLLHYGVREHAMCAISNGLALYGGFLPYESCFLSFSDYLKPALRMSAMMGLRKVSVFSHDSFLSGEDGPTHQPIEQLGTLRSIPNLVTVRAYNATEILLAYCLLLQNKQPVALLIDKNKPEILTSDIEKCLKGGYAIQDARRADLTIVATGSDVSKAIKIADILKNKNITARVVSMPCFSLFENQTNTYKKSVLKDMPKVFLESSNDKIWYKMAEKTDLVLGVESFGTSAKPSDVAQYFGFTPDIVSEKIISWQKNLKKLKNNE